MTTASPYGRFSSIPKFGLAVADVAVELDERARVEQPLRALAGEQLALRRAAARPRAGCPRGATRRAAARAGRACPPSSSGETSGRSSVVAISLVSPCEPCTARPLRHLAVRGRRARGASTTRATATRPAPPPRRRSDALDGGRALLFALGLGGGDGRAARAARAGRDGRSRRGLLLRDGHAHAAARAAGACGSSSSTRPGRRRPVSTSSGWRRRRTRCSVVPRPRGGDGVTRRGCSSTRPRRRPCCCGRSNTAPTSCCTARRSTSAATPTSCSARSSAPDETDHDRLLEFRTKAGIGAAADPAWLLLRSLETLELRVRASRRRRSSWRGGWRTHPRVDVVRYPGPRRPARRALDARRLRRPASRSTSQTATPRGASRRRRG